MTHDTYIGPHGHDYSALVNCLTTFHDERIVFVPNPGNAGDNILNLGAYRLFQDLGIDYECGSRGNEYRGRVIVHGGGGSLVPHYPEACTFFRKNHDVCAALVLLPHTIRTHADLISEMDARCHVFAREQPSHDFVEQHRAGAHVYKSHDMAFLLDREFIAGLSWEPGDLYRLGLSRSWLKMLVKFKVLSKVRGSSLYSFRDDCESAYARNFRHNFDMSRMFATADMNLKPCINVAKAISGTLGSFGRIETDRLHIAILSAILGLPVRMHDNNYGKNRAVFSHSIEHRFANVEFVEGASPEKVNEAWKASPAMRKAGQGTGAGAHKLQF